MKLLILFLIAIFICSDAYAIRPLATANSAILWKLKRDLGARSEIRSNILAVLSVHMADESVADRVVNYFKSLDYQISKTVAMKDKVLQGERFDVVLWRITNAQDLEIRLQHMT